MSAAAVSGPLSIFVSSATGRIGRPLTRRLLQRGYRVRALTRHPESQAAQGLRERGAEVVQGDLDNLESIVHLVAGTEVVFVATTPHGAGPEREVRQAMNLIQAAAQARARHIVYSSVEPADRETGIPIFESKRTVERHLASMNVGTTVVAPVYYMENLLTSALPLPPTNKIQLIAVEDVAAFVAHVIAAPDRLGGRRIGIASDEADGHAVAQSIRRAASKWVGFRPASVEALAELQPIAARAVDWFEREGFGVNVEHVRAEFPQISWQRIGAWAARQDWSQLRHPSLIGD